MNGTGVPVVTPFDDAGTVDEAKLREVVRWVTDRGVDFLLACGSTGESELLTADERARVVEVVADESPVPVLAGVGHPGLAETLAQIDRVPAGVSGVLVVTPFYYDHDQETLAAYYRQVADASDVPVYLYSVPSKTGVRLDPETVGELAEHGNVRGLKDSSGDLVALQRELRLVPDDFAVFVGHGGLYAQGLDAGTDGGILAVANVVPGRVADLLAAHRAGRTDEARRLGSTLVELNRAVTARYGVAGLKAAMGLRGVPAGRARSPHRPVDAEAEREIEGLLDAALSA